jgi:putative ABC transport system permease protein
MRNHFKIALRNLFKRKGYSALNILGLTLGMTSCLLIFHYSSYEQSYDSHVHDAENIYRLEMDNFENGELTEKWATTFPAIAPILKKEYASVSESGRLYHAKFLLANDDQNKKFHETKGYFADPSIIDLFNIQLVSGDRSSALNSPDKIIISEQMAEKYFGKETAIGKKLTVKNVPFNSFEVSGVFKAHPKNSHLVVEYLISFQTFSNWYRTWREGFNTETGFEIIDFFTYVKLQKGVSPKKFEKELVLFSDKYLKPDKINKSRIEFKLINIRDIHLYSNSNQEAETNGNGQRIKYLFIIAIFIICIAWINYINLTTARSVERAKEVGVKKVLGALRKDLFKQFTLENCILNSVSLILSIVLFYCSLTYFDLFTGRDAYTDLTLSAKNWFVFSAIFLVGTFLSGIYPAVVLSSFLPVKVLKGAFKNSTSGLFLRKSLIVTQFAITVMLISGTIVVYEQLQYMRNKDLGIDIKQTLILRGSASTKRDVYPLKFTSFKNELLSHSDIKSVTASNHVLAQEIFEGGGAERLDGNQKKVPYMSILRGDKDFTNAYGLKIINGRDFLNDTETKTVIINESSVEALEFSSPQEALNHKLILDIDTLTIVGVMADYHQEGLQKPIIPILLRLTPQIRNYYSIKISSENVHATIDKINATWKNYFPDEPFNYFFLDESFDQQYKTDLLFGKVFGLFAFLAIFIACSGLLGLSSYNILQRTKEIGIRQVLGASAKRIVVLLLKDFIAPVLTALVIALPLGWILMHYWLQDYAYRITLSAWMFAFASLVAISIALLTIYFQAMRAAVANPVKSLRTE